MIDIVQWRSSIGGFNGCRGPSTTISHGSSTHHTTNNCVLHIPSLPIFTIVSLLLILAGDVETNPGPVTVGELVEALKDLVYWETFAIYLPMISSSDIQKVSREYSGSIDIQKFHLYSLWLDLYPNASWNDVVQALRKTRHHDMATKIEEEKIIQAYNRLPQPMECSSKSGTSVTDVAGTSNDSSSSSVDQHFLPSTSESDQISQMPQCVQHFRRHYKGYYARTKTPAYHNKKPSPSITEFINLILVHQKQSKESRNDKIATLQHKMKGDTEKITNKRKTLAIDELGKLDKSQALVLIKGDPGVGKTTLAWELCKGWTEGRLLQTWDIVLLVQLRAKNIREANTLQSLIDPYNDAHMRGICEYIQDNNGAGLMLIFDGFDELSDTQRQDASFFMRLLRGEILPEVSIILTTRPSAKKLIPEVYIDSLDQLIEIHGFEEKAIHHYIECKFKDNSDILEAFQDYVSSHHFIFSLMYVPLHCALITDLYEYYCDSGKREVLPKTLTELYTCLIRCLIWRNTGREIRSISELSDDLKPKFTELAKIAAMGIEKKQYVFDDIIFDASLDKLGLLQRVEIVSDYGSTSESCSFLHLTLQEYLAAYYWSTQKDVSILFDSDGILPVKNHLVAETKGNYDDSFHWPAVHFYSGLTGIEGTPLEPIIEACQTKLNGSITYNYLFLLFESTTVTSGNNDNTKIHAAFAIDYVSKIKVKFSSEAYVTGYCIARANESVKWELKMEKSGFIKNLIHGIEHGKLENIKAGSVIQSIRVASCSSDCDVFHFLNYLEKISRFLKNLNLDMITSSFQSSPKGQWPIVLNYTFDLAMFSFDSSICTSENCERKKFIKALLSTLKQFKSLRAVSLNGCFTRCITDTTVDDLGQVHLHVINDNDNTDEYCFLGPDINPSLNPAYVFVKQFIDKEFGFGFLEHEYVLYQMPIKVRGLLFNSIDKMPDLVILCDLHYHPLLVGDIFAFHIYNAARKIWIILKMMQDGDKLRVLVSPENIQLLMDILKETKIKRFKLVGDSDSDYLKPLLQLIRDDLKGSLEIRKDRPQLAVTLDMSDDCIGPKTELMNKKDLIHWIVHNDFKDQLDLLIHHCSIYEVISFKIRSSRSSRKLLNFEKFRTLIQTVLCSKSSTLKQFELEKWDPNDDEAKVICDGLVYNQGLEVVAFRCMEPVHYADLFYKGLIDHATLKTLILRRNERLYEQKMLPLPVLCSGKNLKYLFMELNNYFTIDEYSILCQAANNKTIEEVAIVAARLMPDDNVHKLWIKKVFKMLLELQPNYKLVIFCPEPSHFTSLLDAALRSQVMIKSYNEFTVETYEDSFLIVK